MTRVVREEIVIDTEVQHARDGSPDAFPGTNGKGPALAMAGAVRDLIYAGDQPTGPYIFDRVLAIRTNRGRVQ
jgi:hypothetical protein